MSAIIYEHGALASDTAYTASHLVELRFQVEHQTTDKHDKPVIVTFGSVKHRGILRGRYIVIFRGRVGLNSEPTSYKYG